MPRYAQLVMGPAGSGKSRYCSTMVKHAEEIGRTIHVVNLDPAAEYFDYPVLADVRDLISVSDAMEDETLRFGPNGGLIFCMEYLAENFDWLGEQLDDDVDDDYILFDCPGQIELYTHIPAMKQLVDRLKEWNFNTCGIFVIDSQFMIQASKFVCGVMSTLSTMVNLEIPHLNIMSKIDLLNTQGKKDLERFLEPNMLSLLNEEFEGTKFGQKFQTLNEGIANMLDQYAMVKFFPLDISDEESIHDILTQADICIQYGEDLEHKEQKDQDYEPPDDVGFCDD